MNIEEAYNTIKKSVEAINTRPYATKAEYEKVECIKVLLTAYEKEKEKKEELIKERAKEIIYVDKNFVRKDKIKAKIEELEKQQKEEPDAYLCIKVLQSLLEKE